MMTTDEKKVIKYIQGDIEVGPKPFEAVARATGLSENQVIIIINDLFRRGVIRRFGATLKHQASGFGANALVAWLVPDAELERMGTLLASFREVSHCYHRPPQGDWIYNLFTMVHAATETECYEIADRMSKKSGLNTYELLFSRQELKKTSMTYVP
ncbi:MAG: Lrp/AsnC family transcriptional regulator [Deltaproteobacteria bacterium]|nr:Lrp/AsnC family transcriptional regulator [Deltaproteobacteria bacterium]